MNKERPILFSGPMVRAILDDTKSQTRRVVKPNKMHADGYIMLDHGNGWHPYNMFGDSEVDSNGIEHPIPCPYGQPGDRLWVRETWQGPLMDAEQLENEYRDNLDKFQRPEFCVYAADGGSAPEFITLDDELVCRWRPSIHMPRWASRILLEIVGVRIERLNSISQADAQAEGWNPVADDGCNPAPLDPRSWYRDLWDRINGPDSWSANPWVWVINFKRVTP